jgi:hypothetical protein
VTEKESAWALSRHLTARRSWLTEAHRRQTQQTPKETTMRTFSFVEFMREGGWGMWPIMLLGFVTLASSIRYMARPERYCMPFIASLWVALLMVIAHATISDFAAVLSHLSDPAQAPEGQVARSLFAGLKESTRPAGLGGIFLTLSPLLVAGGIYRRWASERPSTFR